MKKLIHCSMIIFLVSMVYLGSANNQGENRIKPREGVILILADDMAAHLSTLGIPVINTATADALSREEVLFTNAFSACASRSLSRSSILTGMHPHANGYWRNTFTPRMNAPEREFTRNAERFYDHVGAHEFIPPLTDIPVIPVSQAWIYTFLF